MPPEMLDADIATARDLVARAGRIVVLTGAGISAESGVPTFRGERGLWRQHLPEDLATPEAFARDPQLVWQWYAWRRRVVLSCAPNAAHIALARLALRRDHMRIVTQNVDGLHARAARTLEHAGPLDNALPIELHGSIFRLRCCECLTTSFDDSQDREIGALADVPRCQDCNSLTRPDVVWFGEPLPSAALQTAFQHALVADVCLVVGTSAVVFPAIQVALTAHSRGAALIEVNPDPTPLTSLASVSLRCAATLAVPALAADP